MAYDSARGVTVLFGGYVGSAGASRETWEWNGSVWRRRVIAGPAARYGHAMAYDSARGVTVLFGGYRDGVGGADGETWELRIYCPADMDDGSGSGYPAGGVRDGAVTIDDLLYFLAAYEAGDTHADMDDASGSGYPDGGVAIEDLLYFLARYEAGC